MEILIQKKEFDIRKYVDLKKNCKLMINNHLEMALFEIVCMLINKNINKNNIKYNFTLDIWCKDCCCIFFIFIKI